MDWINTALLTVILAGGGYWMHRQDERLGELEDTAERVARRVAVMTERVKQLGRQIDGKRLP